MFCEKKYWKSLLTSEIGTWKENKTIVTRWKPVWTWMLGYVFWYNHTNLRQSNYWCVFTIKVFLWILENWDFFCWIWWYIENIGWVTRPRESSSLNQLSQVHLIHYRKTKKMIQQLLILLRLCVCVLQQLLLLLLCLCVTTTTTVTTYNAHKHFSEKKGQITLYFNCRAFLGNIFTSNNWSYYLSIDIVLAYISLPKKQVQSSLL